MLNYTPPNVNRAATPLPQPPVPTPPSLYSPWTIMPPRPNLPPKHPTYAPQDEGRCMLLSAGAADVTTC